MLLSVKEAAALLGIKDATLRKWVQQRRITFYRIGRHPKFKQQDLDRFLEQLRVPAIPRMKGFRPRSFKKAE
ncbi:hypothetical protein BAC1_01599 [uncultured bacterium]|nr:hypothetical protein BAC1_01599 [uncultured bacterium]